MKIDHINDLLGTPIQPAPVPTGQISRLPRAVESHDKSWLEKLDLDDNGGVRNTFANIRLIIANDPRTRGLFAHNLQLNGDVFRKPPGLIKRRTKPGNGLHQIHGPLWKVSDHMVVN